MTETARLAYPGDCIRDMGGNSLHNENEILKKRWTEQLRELFAHKRLNKRTFITIYDTCIPIGCRKSNEYHDEVKFIGCNKKLIEATVDLRDLLSR